MNVWVRDWRETHYALERGHTNTHTHTESRFWFWQPAPRTSKWFYEWTSRPPDNKQESALSAKPSQYIWTPVCLQRAPHIQVVNNLISCFFFKKTQKTIGVWREAESIRKRLKGKGKKNNKLASKEREVDAILRGKVGQKKKRRRTD